MKTLIRMLCLCFYTLAHSFLFISSGVALADNYKLEYDTDFSGFDLSLRPGVIKTRDIPIESCMSFCDIFADCVGFTYNEKARACFLKTNTSGAIPFKGAISGVKASGITSYLAPSAQPAPTSYTIEYNTDFSGADMPFALNNPEFRNIPVETCMAYCDRIDGCSAFTYNIKARVCFPKIGRGTPSSFKGAVSGVKAYLSTQMTEKETPQNESGFELAYDTDFSGSDIPFALNNREFRNISIETCMAYCNRLDGCAAFTYNANARVCFPKFGKGSPVRFAGAISGIKGPAPVTAAPNSSLAGDQNPYLQRSRCDEVYEAANSIAKAAKVDVSEHQFKIGQGRAIRASVPSSAYRLPAFLVLTFDQPVRFRGKGFYVLSPEATGAFDSHFGRGNTRVVLPLFPKSRQPSVDFELVQITLAKLHVEASIVVQSGCGERVVSISSWNIPEPVPLAPKVLVFDPYSTGNPKVSYVSPDGARYVDVYDGFFRIISARTNLPIAEVVGTEPAFSPTGRFVGTFVGDFFEVYDSIDGNLLQTQRGDNVLWDDSDSFVLVDKGVWGGLAVISPTMEAKAGATILAEFGGMGAGCQFCDAATNTKLKVDFNNNVVIAAFDDEEVQISSITTNFYSDRLDALNSESGISSIAVPRRWETIDKLRFSHFLKTTSPNNKPDLDGDYAKIAQNFMFRQLQRQVDYHSSSVAKVPLAAKNRQSSGKQIDISHFLSRLEKEYGIKFETSSLSFQRLSDAVLKRKNGSGQEISSFKFDNRISLIDDFDLTENTDIYKKGHTYTRMHGSNFAVWELKGKEETIRLLGSELNMGLSGGVYGAIEGIYFSSKPYMYTYHPTGVHYYAESYVGSNCGGDCDINAKLIGGRYVVVSSASDAIFSIYDIEENISSRVTAYRGRSISDVFVSTDGLYFIQLNSDGTFALFDSKKQIGDAEPGELWLDPLRKETSSGESKADGLEMDETAVDRGDVVSDSVRIMGKYDDDELVVWTPDGYYDSTYEGESQVFLKFSGQDDLFSFNQFGALLRRKGLMTEVLSGKADRPKLDYRIPPMIETTVDVSGGGELSVDTVQRSGGAIKSILIYQDGLLTNQQEFPAGASHWSGLIERRPGARWVSVIGVDAGGLTSAPAPVDIGLDTKRRRLAVLAVGVDEYDDTTLPTLQYAKTDAFRFSETVKQLSSSVYDAVEPSSLADAGATKEAILTKIKGMLAEAGEDTDVILYFSGHGLTAGGKLYLGLTETRVDDLPGTALAWSDVAGVVAAAKARTTVFLDACHSGGAGEAQFSTNDGVANTLIGSAGGSVAVFAASKGRQNSLEASDEGGGLFTSAMARILGEKRETYDTNGNGAIEATEFYRAIKSEVAITSDGQQTPWLAMNRMVGDFALF